MWQVSVIHNAQANSFSFSLYSAGCQGSRTAGWKLQWLSLLPCNSIRKASMKSIFIVPSQNHAAQWNDNEQVHKGDRLNDKFLKRCCSGWPSVQLPNTHGHMGLYPQGFTPIPHHLYPRQTVIVNPRESHDILSQVVPFSYFASLKGKKMCFLNTRPQRSTYNLLDRRQCSFKWHRAQQGHRKGNERELPTLRGSAEGEELHSCAFRARQYWVLLPQELGAFVL